MPTSVSPPSSPTAPRPAPRGSTPTRRLTAPAVGTGWRRNTWPKPSTKARCPGPHRPDLARRLRGVSCTTTSTICRELTGPARAGACRGHGIQDGEPGLDRDLLPGRRGPRRVHRPGRDRERCTAGDPDHGHLHQQRHLRDDRRPDGSHHPHRPANDHHAGGPDTPGRPADEDGGAHLGLDGPVDVERCAVRQQAADTRQARHQESAPAAGRRHRVRLHRGLFRVPGPSGPRPEAAEDG